MQLNSRAIVIHGTSGNPDENWFPWLRNKLLSRGYTVIVPQFPTPKGQELKTWLSVLDEAVPIFDKTTIMIGHSIGCALILRKLERLRQPIQAGFLVSGFMRELGLVDSINASFLRAAFELEKIRENCGQFFIYHSDDDPFVPLSQGRELATSLEAHFRIIIGGGHLNASSGFTHFETLWEDIDALK